MEPINGGNSGTFRFGVGSVLARTFSTLFRSFGVFFGLTLLVVLAGGVIEYLLPAQGVAKALGQIINVVLGLLIQGAIACGVFQTLRHGTASFGECLLRGTARIFPLTGAALLMGLCIWACTGLPVLLMAAMWQGGSGGWSLLFLLVAMAALCLTFVLGCMWSVAIPACAVEQLGPLTSLKRSAWLTLGERLKIFGLALLTMIAAAFLYWGVSFIALLISRSLLFTGLSRAIFLIFARAFGNVMVAVVYYDLRMAREGVSIDSLADVFD
ncbi:MAG: hypothetical protein LBQ90_00405 [Synergistaceae bacterium]|jgi:hypothetical protein|nr:hypothetical protein [Synergistaceae bacterium]